VRVWFDLTNAPHVAVLEPIARVLAARGDEILWTGRSFGQTQELAELHGLDVEVVGGHGGRGRLGKARAAGDRVRRLALWARGRGIDAGIGHGSTDQPIVGRLLRFPTTTMFDYEFAVAQHSLNCRFARRVLVPDAIPPERLRRYGAGPGKLVRYPGLKEEYALAGFVPDPSVRPALGLSADGLLAVVRTPPELALYHRFENPVFEDVLRRLAGHGRLETVVLPRTAAPGERLRSLGLPRVLVPEHAIAARSLVAVADLCVSAGGTMNREAAVLGTPVYTTFAGRIGAVDEALLAAGRLRRLEQADDVVIEPRTAPVGVLQPRDPALLADLALT
jgi:predicted glycosyltransferase